MKKQEYIKPQIKVRDFRTNTFLAGSIDVGLGTTSEQNAKPSLLFEDNGLDIGLEDDIFGRYKL